MRHPPLNRQPDNRKLIYRLMRRADVRPLTAAVIRAAYDAGYEQHSDGITLMPELAFSGFRMKHPAGVGHDWLYYMGLQNPFLPADTPRTHHIARKWADAWFRNALLDFGHPIRARVWWLGLRLAAWYGWNRHRKAGNPK